MRAPLFRSRARTERFTVMRAALVNTLGSHLKVRWKFKTTHPTFILPTFLDEITESGLVWRNLTLRVFFFLCRKAMFVSSKAVFKERLSTPSYHKVRSLCHFPSLTKNRSQCITLRNCFFLREETRMKLCWFAERAIWWIEESDKDGRERWR